MIAGQVHPLPAAYVGTAGHMLMAPVLAICWWLQCWAYVDGSSATGHCWAYVDGSSATGHCWAYVDGSSTTGHCWPYVDGSSATGQLLFLLHRSPSSGKCPFRNLVTSLSPTKGTKTQYPIYGEECSWLTLPITQ